MNELTVQSSYAIMPVMDIESAITRRKAIIEFTSRVMVEGVDYGKIPGSDKDVLLKPGGEKLTTLFGLSPGFVVDESVTDWTGANHDGEPFFYFKYRCVLKRGDMVVGDGLGSCNSWEKKYRFRNADVVCPKCNKPAIIKGKAQYGGGWLCWSKKGGCGTKFTDKDPAIINQDTSPVKNDNPADLVNTIDKMAQKRAFIAAILIAVNASEFYTQDFEDMDFGIIDVTPEPQPDPTPTDSRGDMSPAAQAQRKPIHVPTTSDQPKGKRQVYTVGIACAAAVIPDGHFSNEYHALQALKSNYKVPNLWTDKGFEMKMTQVISESTYTELLDWLTAYSDSKSADSESLLNEMVDGVLDPYLDPQN